MPNLGTTPEIAIFAIRLIMVAAVYVFLLWVVAAARAEVSTGARTSGTAARRLVVVAAPPSGPEPGVAIALQPRTTIGRATDNVLVVADNVVSAQHASITLQGDRWWVEDLGSTNGTLVNDRWVRSPVPVTVGDEVQVGPARFRLEA